MAYASALQDKGEIISAILDKSRGKAAMWSSKCRSHCVKKAYSRLSFQKNTLLWKGGAAQKERLALEELHQGWDLGAPLAEVG